MNIQISSETVEREQWLVARLKVLAMEKALTKARDELTAARQALPRVKIDHEYKFEDLDRTRSLADLFGDRSQLLVQHFMFGVDWDAGCPSCSFWADGYDGITAHLNARDISLVAVSSAPASKLNTYRKRMGWSFEWVSSAGSSFSQDFGVVFSAEELEASTGSNYNFGTSRFTGSEAPGISVFEKSSDESIYHTYSTYGRGLDVFNPAYQLMDIVPKGRDESQFAHTMGWLKRRDEY